MVTALALSWTLAVSGPAAAAASTLDAAASAAIAAAVRARLGESAEVTVESVSRIAAPTAALVDAVLDPAAAIGVPSRVVFRRRQAGSERPVPVGGATVVLRVAVDHVHAARAIARGHTIGDGDVVTARHDLPRGALRPFPGLAEIVDGVATRDLKDGACVVAAAVAAQPVVRPGATVTGLLRIDGVEVRAVLVAMDSGKVGGRIRVMNPDSRRTFRARILTRDLVEIQP
jgi:flagella basal body P-ring formation protein FlgA